MNKEERNAYARAWRAKNVDKVRAQARARYAADPEYHKAKSIKHILNFRKNNPNANRNKHYKKRYGITVEEYESMAKAQNYLCAICEKPETKTRKDGSTMILSVDHDHLTGQVRDLLCSKCNILLGYLETGNVTFSQLINYRKKHSDKSVPND